MKLPSRIPRGSVRHRSFHAPSILVRPPSKGQDSSPEGRDGAFLMGAVAPAAYVVGSGDVVSGVVVVPIGMVPMDRPDVVAAPATPEEVPAVAADDEAAPVV